MYHWIVKDSDNGIVTVDTEIVNPFHLLRLKSHNASGIIPASHDEAGSPVSPFDLKMEANQVSETVFFKIGTMDNTQNFNQDLQTTF